MIARASSIDNSAGQRTPSPHQPIGRVARGSRVSQALLVGVDRGRLRAHANRLVVGALVVVSASG